MSDLIRRYERFAISNSQVISSIESSLRTLSYILPGRFNDAALVSEICKIVACKHNCIVYSLLNCLRWFHDSIYYKRYSTAVKSSWNNYLDFINTEYPIAGKLMKVLMAIRFVEVPSEMIVQRLLGIDRKYVFVAVVELCKYYR